MKTSAGQLKKGYFINHNGDVYQIVKIDHSHVGRGSANLKMKIKSVANGNTLELTFKPDNSVEQVEVQSTQMQYLYHDAQDVTFMNGETYEQVSVPVATVGKVLEYLSEGENVYVAMHDGEALAIIPPSKVTLEVTEAEDAAKGNTATNARKPVTVQTGAQVMVPIFIKKGEKININPETGEYLERSN